MTLGQLRPQKAFFPGHLQPPYLANMSQMPSFVHKRIGFAFRFVFQELFNIDTFVHSKCLGTPWPSGID